MGKITRYISFIIFIALISLGFSSMAVEDRSLEIGDLINFGEFHGEPILWQVVNFDENGNPLLLSKNIIDFKPFDASGDRHSQDGYYNWAQYYGSNQWETSTLRQWLNSTRNNVNWELNPPSEENVFRGINSYDDESGFLHRQNFPISQRSMILKSGLSDHVFLLTYEEYKEYYSNMDFFPLFTPTEGAIERSDYPNRDIKLGLSYDILTKDPIEESPHAVMVFKDLDSMETAIASVGNKGLAPAIYLDADKIAAGEISGEGTILKPYEIKGRLPINILMIISIILVVSLLLVGILKKRKARLAILLITLTFSTACQPDMLENHVEEYNEPKVIVLPYANREEVILDRLDDFFNNIESEFIIIDEEGKNQSNWVIDNCDKPNTKEELRKMQEDLYQNGFWIVKGGDFRISTMKDEIDSVFDDIGLIVTSRHISEDPRSKFVKDMKPLYEEGDYGGIIRYLEENQYIIMHPYDLYSYGISIINLEIDY